MSWWEVAWAAGRTRSRAFRRGGGPADCGGGWAGPGGRSRAPGWCRHGRRVRAGEHRRHDDGGPPQAGGRRRPASCVACDFSGVCRAFSAAGPAACSVSTGSEEEDQPDLCDVCGALVLDSSQWHALVRDSSTVHAVDPTCDGQRKVIGYSLEHLAELIDQYTRRRFVDAELRAGKVARALWQHPKGPASRSWSGRDRADRRSDPAGCDAAER